MIKSISLTRDEVVGIYKLLSNKRGKSFSPKFSFFVLRNLKFMEEEINVIDEINKQITGIVQEFQTARVSIASEYADKDEDGNPIIINGDSFSLKENQKEFQEKINELREEHKESIDKHDELVKQLQEVALEEIEQKVLTISYLDIPENEFTIEELGTLMQLLKETEDELDELIMG